MADGQTRKDIVPGLEVSIVHKQDQRTGKLTRGIVLAGEKPPSGWASGKATRFVAFDAKTEARALVTPAARHTDGRLIAK